MRPTHTFVTTAALALGLAFAAQAHAQPHHERSGPAFHHGGGPGHAGHGGPPHRPPHYHAGGPGWQPHMPPPGMRPHPGWRPPPPPPPYAGHGHHRPAYRWAPGVRVPHEYRAARYRVSNWRRHGLYAPPRGHYWVQHGPDYLLVAVATGVIASLIVNGH